MLVVKGEASIFQAADQMEVSLGVLTVAPDSSQAMFENNEKIHQAMQNLEVLGLAESDYQTGRFRIRPIYKTSKNQNYVINHYEVVNTIQVKTLRLDLADKILQEAVRAGVNQIDQVRFSLHNPQTYRAEVIAAAAQNALSDANALAAATGVQLKRVMHVSLDHWQNLPAPYTLNRAVEAGGQEFLDAIEPGNAEIHVTVNITYEIATIGT
jgi:uncharacterized protein YggE